MAELYAVGLFMPDKFASRVEEIFFPEEEDNAAQLVGKLYGKLAYVVYEKDKKEE